MHLNQKLLSRLLQPLVEPVTQLQHEPSTCSFIGAFFFGLIPQQSNAGDEDEADDSAGASYQLDMMRCLREVNVDNNTVGW